MRKLDEIFEPRLDAVLNVYQAEGALKTVLEVGMYVGPDVAQAPPQKTVRPRIPARGQYGAQVALLLLHAHLRRPETVHSDGQTG
jgi:hypothetical protein